MKTNRVYIVGIFCAILMLNTINWNAALAQETEPAADFEAIDAFVTSNVSGANLPGLALGMVHADELVLFKASASLILRGAPSPHRLLLCWHQ